LDRRISNALARVETRFIGGDMRHGDVDYDLAAGNLLFRLL